MRDRTAWKLADDWSYAAAYKDELSTNEQLALSSWAQKRADGLLCADIWGKLDRGRITRVLNAEYSQMGSLPPFKW
jgi:hypothetical protein